MFEMIRRHVRGSPQKTSQPIPVMNMLASHCAVGGRTVGGRIRFGALQQSPSPAGRALEVDGGEVRSHQQPAGLPAGSHLSATLNKTLTSNTSAGFVRERPPLTSEVDDCSNWNAPARPYWA